jgi:hypothetical protein
MLEREVGIWRLEIGIWYLVFGIRNSKLQTPNSKLSLLPCSRSRSLPTNYTPTSAPVLWAIVAVASALRGNW